MRHLIPIAICTVAVAALVPVAVNAHHGYIHQLNVQNAKAAALHAKATIKAQYQVLTGNKKLQTANTDIVLLVAQCKEGQAAYNMLTVYQKQQVHAPNCNYVTVQ